MKGAKGGKRDRDISYRFHIKNTELEKEFLEETVNNGQRIYEDKQKSLENADVSVSPLADKDLAEDSVSIAIEDDESLEENSDVKKKIDEEIAISEQKGKIGIEDETFLEEKNKTKDEKSVELEERADIKKEETVKLEEKENIKKEEIVQLEEDKRDILEDIEVEEAYLFYELEKAVKEDLYDLKDIENRVKLIEDKLEDEYLQEEIEELKKELEILLEKFVKLKYKYENFDFDIHPDIDDSYIESLISSYGDSIKNNDHVSDLISQIEETKSYIGIIETVAYTENKIRDLDDRIDDKYKEFGIRDTSFDSLDDEVYDIEKIREKVDFIAYDIEENLKQIRDKMNQSLDFNTYTKTISETIPRIDRVVSAALLMTTAALLPNTFRANIVKAGLMAGAIHNLAHVMEHRESTEVKTEVNYVDYSREIIDSAKDINDVSYIIDDALKDIDSIRYQLNTEFREYIDLIPEYKTLMENIDRMEKQLEEQKYLMEKYDAELKQQLQINEEKKYIKEYDK